MYNLRYHLASLAAVFLSLAIGVLLGSIVVERGTLDGQRDSIVEALQEEFRTLSEENSSLSEENDALQAFVNDTLPVLLGGQLDGRTIIVIVNAGRVDGLGSVSDALRMAGANPVTVTLNEPSLGLGAESVSNAATSVIGPQPAEELVDSVTTALLAEWANPVPGRPLTAALATSGGLTIGDLPPDAVVDGIVHLAAWDDGPDEAVFQIATEMVASGGTAVAAETPTHETGLAAAAAERGLSAVDDVGTPEGQYAMVMVLAGRAEGHFGQGPGSQARYPAPSTLTAPEAGE